MQHTHFFKWFKASAFLYLPLFAAIMLEAHIRFLSLQLNSGTLGTGANYLLINLQLAFECIPFFIAHRIASEKANIKSVLSWLMGFIGYPCLLLLFNTVSSSYEAWQLLSVQCWIFCMVSSATWLIYQHMNKKEHFVLPWLQPLFSLNGMVTLLITGWAMVMAGVFNTVLEPMLNQPFNLLIDIHKIVTDFSSFIYYLMQFCVFSLLMLALYLFNRYVLIRQILTEQGIPAFLMASLTCLLIYTPLSVFILLQLPLNDLPSTVTNLTPGGDQNIFNRYNYQFTFFFLAVSTPIILAFERQQQHAQMSEIAQQQTQTELKLLQQQINPHFLFNTLNNLYALTLEKSNDAPELVIKLSNLLRYSVYEGQKKQVNLAKEIDYLKNFISLQSIRSGDKCTFITQWPAEAAHYSMAPLLLIVLLENIIKHGVEPTSGSVNVEFKLSLKGNILQVIGVNPIHDKTSNESGGLGLVNLKRRLALLYSGKHTFVQNQKNQHWHTTLIVELTPC
ncbi:sensor histidine kinase [Thalassotalea piscium]